MTEHKDLYVVNRYGDIFFLAKERIVKITPKRVYFTEGSPTTWHLDKDDRVFEDLEEAKKLSYSIYAERIEESIRITAQLERQGHEQQSIDWFKEANWFNTR